MLKTLLALYSGALNNVLPTLEKTDILVGSNTMTTHTLQVTSEQRALIAKALEKFGQYTIGQTLREQEYAKKLSAQFVKNKNSTTIDLSSVEIK